MRSMGRRRIRRNRSGGAWKSPAGTLGSWAGFRPNCCRTFSNSCLPRYRMRWGLPPQSSKIRQCAWKKLYIQRDEEDMTDLVRNCPSEFKEYYIQMQAAKRSQVPVPSQVNKDRLLSIRRSPINRQYGKRAEGFLTMWSLTMHVWGKLALIIKSVMSSFARKLGMSMSVMTHAENL
ncbi:hypothetical protein MLD38_019119 [Melastoma candidum]|uniref:Uncharacterized protein n=1 Tax=Melastoma candidum TaxID=119954 RepID=A0ACB9QW26_9MYRT|nr:hypothetical protein MLD38_019119 [Melastoma candidum]